MFVEPSMYSNLKLQTSHDANSLQSHINAHQSVYPDSTSHLINTSPSSLSAAAAGDVSISGSYHSNYAFRTTETASVSSTETNYVINSNIVTSNQANSTTVLASSTTGIHQRRGSLQLWQFLVALLDEPAAR